MSHQILRGKIRVGTKNVRVIIPNTQGIETGIYKLELVLPLTDDAKNALTNAYRYGNFENVVKEREGKDVVRVTFEAPLYYRTEGSVGKRKRVVAISPPIPVILTLSRVANIKNAVVYVKLLEKLAPTRPLRASVDSP